MRKTPFLTTMLALCALPAASAEMRITEWMYNGTAEFIEFTNVGLVAVDMTGWSFDDDSQVPGTVSLSAYGVVQPGESVLLIEGDEAAFTADWSISGVKIISGNTTNLGRNDEINLYDASNALVDRLTYGDQTFPGTIRTNEISGWTYEGNIGQNNIYFWILSTPGDAQGTVTSTSGMIGNPGTYVSTAATQSFARINEAYVSHAGVDNQEFIELYGISGGPLTNVMVLVVEGDGAGAGTLDRAFNLTGNSIPVSDNYFVLGNTTVTNLDFNFGADNVLENGTETIYLIEATDPAAVSALVGTNVINGSGATLIPTLGTVLDVVALADGGVIAGTDQVFDGAQTLGPDEKSFLPPGIYRGGDWPAPWCGAFLDFDNVVNLLQPRTPGEVNSPCYVLDYGAGCAGNGGFTPRLQLRGDTGAGGTLGVSIFEAEGGALAVLMLGFTQTEVPATAVCDLLVGPAPLFPIVLAVGGTPPNPGEGDITFTTTLPVTAASGSLYLQAFTADSTKPVGYTVSNGVKVTLH